MSSTDHKLVLPLSVQRGPTNKSNCRLHSIPRTAPVFPAFLQLSTSVDIYLLLLCTFLQLLAASSKLPSLKPVLPTVLLYFWESFVTSPLVLFKPWSTVHLSSHSCPEALPPSSLVTGSCTAASLLHSQLPVTSSLVSPAAKGSSGEQDCTGTFGMVS